MNITTKKMKMKNAIKIMMMLGFFTFLSTTDIKAQDLGSSYRTAIGAKFYPGGITLKHFVNSSTALEAIGYFYNRGSRLTGLYEFHGNIGGAPGLRWYIGPGAHVAFYNSKFFNGGETVGIDGVVGLDYKFRGAPINISLDWQPSFEFGDYAGFSSGWGGFAVRFTF